MREGDLGRDVSVVVKYCWLITETLVTLFTYSMQMIKKLLCENIAQSYINVYHNNIN